MKFFLLSLIFFSINIVNFAYGETWSCAYNFQGKVKNKILIRDGKLFKDEDGYTLSTYINESNDYIHIYQTIGNFGTYFATYLDKKNNKFSMVGLDPNNNTKIITGNCIVF